VTENAERSDPKLVFVAHQATLQKAIKQPHINRHGVLCLPCSVLLVAMYGCRCCIYMLKGLTCIVYLWFL